MAWGFFRLTPEFFPGGVVGAGVALLGSHGASDPWDGMGKLSSFWAPANLENMPGPADMLLLWAPMAAHAGWDPHGRLIALPEPLPNAGKAWDCWGWGAPASHLP